MRIGELRNPHKRVNSIINVRTSCFICSKKLVFVGEMVAEGTHEY